MNIGNNQNDYKLIKFYPRFYSFKIPKDWNYTQFEEQLDIIKGVSYTSEEINNNNSGKILINLACFKKQGGFNRNGIKYFKGKLDNKALLNENDLLIANTDVTLNGQVVGYPIKVPNLNSKEIIHSMDTAKIKIKKNGILKDFLYYYLSSDFVHNCMRSFCSGTTVLHLDIKSVLKMKLFIPPLKEQQKIASILSNVDNLIQKTEQIIEKTQKLKKGLMERLLTKGIGHTNFKKTLIGELPNDWNLVISRDLFSFVTSGSRGWAKYYSKVGAIFITIGNLQHENTHLNFSYTRKVNPPAGSEGLRTRIQQNDILVSITADVGMVGFVSMPLAEAYVNQHLALARPKNGNDFRFIAWYLASPGGGLKQFKQLQRGVTKKGLGLEDIKNIWVPLPPNSEQQKIANILDSLVSYVDFNFLMKSKLNRLKKGLMHQLLTGKIRVILTK